MWGHVLGFKWSQSDTLSLSLFVISSPWRHEACTARQHSAAPQSAGPTTIQQTPHLLPRSLVNDNTCGIHPLYSGADFDDSRNTTGKGHWLDVSWERNVSTVFVVPIFVHIKFKAREHLSVCLSYELYILIDKLSVYLVMKNIWPSEWNWSVVHYWNQYWLDLAKCWCRQLFNTLLNR